MADPLLHGLQPLNHVGELFDQLGQQRSLRVGFGLRGCENIEGINGVGSKRL
jgi:hypothetical protein